jgi:hypothetical protein
VVEERESRREKTLGTGMVDRESKNSSMDDSCMQREANLFGIPHATATGHMGMATGGL